MSDDITRVKGEEPPDGRRDGDGRGWMLATVALVALLLGVGAGLLLHGDDAKTRTVHGVRTVTASAAPGATSIRPLTVTESVTTVQRTVQAPASTITVTVPAPGATATNGGPG